MKLQYLTHRIAVGGISGERTDSLCEVDRSCVCLAGHEGCYRSSPRTSWFGVVGQPERHQHRTQVGVSQPELAKVPRCLSNGRSGVVRVSDQYVLCSEDNLNGLPKTFYIKPVVLFAV